MSHYQYTQLEYIYKYTGNDLKCRLNKATREKNAKKHTLTFVVDPRPLARLSTDTGKEEVS